MFDAITTLIKSGKLLEAAELLHTTAIESNVSSDTLSDIVVLNGNISELSRQEKRRKITPHEALDIKTRYAFELEDILGELKKRVQPAATNTGVQSNSTNTTLPPQPVHAPPSIENHINISVNVSVENIVTNEIKDNITNIHNAFSDLKRDLAEAEISEGSEAIIDQIQDLDGSLSQMSTANAKEDLPPALEKIKSFLDKVEQGSSTASKIFKLSKQGIDTIQSIAKNYNAVAQWVGAPQVPSVFLG